MDTGQCVVRCAWLLLPEITLLTNLLLDERRLCVNNLRGVALGSEEVGIQSEISNRKSNLLRSKICIRRSVLCQCKARGPRVPQ